MPQVIESGKTLELALHVDKESDEVIQLNVSHVTDGSIVINIHSLDHDELSESAGQIVIFGSKLSVNTENARCQFDLLN